MPKSKCCGTCKYWTYRYTYISGRSDGVCGFEPQPKPLYADDELRTEPDEGKECGCWVEKDVPKVRISGDSFASMLRKLPEPKESDEQA